VHDGECRRDVRFIAFLPVNPLEHKGSRRINREGKLLWNCGDLAIYGLLFMIPYCLFLGEMLLTMFGRDM
jgi:hypothetical protein